uniref:Putative LRR receptor-like serine/threonine-protein kinase At4g36180 isoform X3 n=1 Tax=Rhizophora mucronata TaxID=61149 RepID=A0A2P2MD58_RHIMU
MMQIFLSQAYVN